MVLRPHRNVGGLSEKFICLTVISELMDPSTTSHFCWGSMHFSIVWFGSAVWFGKTGCQWTEHVCAAGKGLHVVKALHFGGWLFRFLVTVTNTWENSQARTYWAHGLRLQCFMSKGQDRAEVLILYRNKEWQEVAWDKIYFKGLPLSDLFFLPRP